jgi:hypothetical protein
MTLWYVRLPMRSELVKVLFIAGAGRSGSTLLDTILGQIDGFVSVGELRYLWERGLLQDRLCGCSEPFSSCEFWTPVVADAFGSPPRVDPQWMIDLQSRGTRIRHLPRILAGADAHVLDDMRPYLEAMGRLYETIRDHSSARVIVDSSKLPTYGHAVGHLKGVDLHVVHLIRDPRATAYSWLRKRTLPDRPGATMQRHRPAKSAALWSVWNWVTERLWATRPDRYLRLRYEDLVREPESAVRSVLSFVSEEPAKLPFVSDRSVDLAATHTVAGNPSRFRTGVVEIRPDDEWLSRLEPRARAIVEAISFPLLRRYGYPFHVRR